MEAGSSLSLPHQIVVLFDLLPLSSLSLCLSSWQVVDAVHENGSFIYLQLWALGRTAFPDVLQEEGGYPLVGPSPIPLPTKKDPNTPPSTPQAVPRALTIEEIKEYMRLFASAAENAVLRAGFDGVEIHAANGYLPDQFLQTNSNTRTDAYGGSVQNRARFVLEVSARTGWAYGSARGRRFKVRSWCKIRHCFCFIFVFLVMVKRDG
jgi:NADPH2 dehydrogenase